MTEIYSFHFCFRILLFYFHLKKYEDFFGLLNFWPSLVIWFTLKKKKKFYIFSDCFFEKIWRHVEICVYRFAYINIFYFVGYLIGIEVKYNQ